MYFFFVLCSCHSAVMERQNTFDVLFSIATYSSLQIVRGHCSFFLFSSHILSNNFLTPISKRNQIRSKLSIRFVLSMLVFDLFRSRECCIIWHYNCDGIATCLFLCIVCVRSISVTIIRWSVWNTPHTRTHTIKRRVALEQNSPLRISHLSFERSEYHTQK